MRSSMTLVIKDTIGYNNGFPPSDKIMRNRLRKAIGEHQGYIQPVWEGTGVVLLNVSSPLYRHPRNSSIRITTFASS